MMSLSAFPKVTGALEQYQRMIFQKMWRTVKIIVVKAVY